jgi:hypothetical protein
LIYETEKELRRGRRTNEALRARLVRQRSTSREHPPMRQYGFLRLPRSIDNGDLDSPTLM